MSSRRIAGRFPAAGTSAIGDLIRQRRAPRDITPLDGALLHFPAFAEGWNTLLGAVRTKGNLPGDVRELIILRVAALNHAAYEWIHHEYVGRSHGLTTAQLVDVRNTATVSTSSLSTLQAAALHFAHASTKEIRVSSSIVSTLKFELGVLVDSGALNTDPPVDRSAQIEDLLVEAAAVVATYNMVSRFLVSLDVAASSESTVPWPCEKEDFDLTLPNSAGTLHVQALTSNGDINARPTLILINSLLTNMSLWDRVLPDMLLSHNVILYDQRGHGRSSVPSSLPPRGNTLDELADDIALILQHLKVGQVEAVIGVSQGGATALNFGIRHPEMTKSIVACDTQAVGPLANIAAWDERIALANATSDGMSILAHATVARWFPAGSPWNSQGGDPLKYTTMVQMVETTNVLGFEAGARALQGYDLVRQEGKRNGKGLLEGSLPTLLLAGQLDAGGNIAQGLKKLQAEWNQVRNESPVQYHEVPGAGHLPMVDEPDLFWKGVSSFLKAAVN